MSWAAPDLNCMAVQPRLDIEGKTGQVITTLIYATSIIKGDPDPSLFTVPGRLPRSGAK